MAVEQLITETPRAFPSTYTAIIERKQALERVLHLPSIRNDVVAEQLIDDLLDEVELSLLRSRCTSREQAIAMLEAGPLAALKRPPGHDQCPDAQAIESVIRWLKEQA